MKIRNEEKQNKKYILNKDIKIIHKNQKLIMHFIYLFIDFEFRLNIPCLFFIIKLQYYKNEIKMYLIRLSFYRKSENKH